MKKLLFNLYFWPVFIALTIIGILVLPFILLYAKLVMGKEPSNTLRLAIRFYGWLLVCGVPFMAPVKVIGDKYSMPNPAIFVANHTSAIDPYLFGAIPVENCFVTSWPFKIPVYSPFMKLAGYINTADGWDKLQKKCTLMLDKGVSVTIWPEGHRSRNGEMGRFRKGAFQLAVETGYPIQPVCILGSGKVMSPGKRLLSPGHITLVLLDPIYSDGEKGGDFDAINDLRQKTFNALKSCIEQASANPSFAKNQQKVETRKVGTDSLHSRPHDFC